MKAWFEIYELRSKVGVITDYFNDINRGCYYLELQDIDTSEYHIVSIDKIKFIYE